jgi:protein tyrosine/serine phosphatase
MSGRHDGFMQQNERILPLTGASNFRDLGGYPLVDAGLTRWGSLFRSDSLHELTDTDVEVLRQLGLRTIIDLRMEVEVVKSGRGLLGSEPATYHHLSVIDEDGGESRGIPAPKDGDLSNRYMWYLEIGRDALVRAFNVLGEAANYPAVFHCAAGKDRTGVLAALVLDIVGVDREVIVEDYVLTASRMELVLERVLRSVGEGRRVDDLPASAVSVEAATMEGFLDRVDQRYGGARQWALAAGVPYESLDALSAFLTDT